MRSLFWIPLLPSLAAALKLPVQQIRRNGSPRINALKALNNLAALDQDNAISSTRDVLYMATVTIDGVDYPLQMDTGSSDLWVNTTKVPTGLTDTAYNLTYGSGYAYGHIARAPVSFAGYDVPDQAFLRFESGNNPVFHFNAVGIVGLGFTTLSHIDAAVSDTGATWGRSLLYNIFALDPTVPNFMAFALERTTDPTDDVQGSFALGEVDDKYAAVQSTDHIPLFPAKGSTRWTVLLDSYASDGTTHPLTTSVSGVPEGRAVVLLDTGTTYSYADPSVAQAIYGNVPGARLEPSIGQWVVPCEAGIYLTLWIAGRPFVIHPLDVVSPSLSDSTVCIGTFIPQKLSVGESEFDWVLGTNVLRSIYSVYDFGDFDSKGKMGEPYVQLLSIVNATEAAADFKQVRGGTVNVQESNGSPSPSVQVEATSEQLDKLVSIIPVLFAIAGANGLILIILLVGLVWFCCSRRQKKTTKKTAPLPLATVTAATHNYEAVPTAEDPLERTSSRQSSRLARTTSKQSVSQRSLLLGVNELPHSPTRQLNDAPSHKSSRHSLLKPQVNASNEDVAFSKPGSMTRKSPSPVPSVRGTKEGVLVDADTAHTEDITEGADKPFKPFNPSPPPPIVAPGYRRSMYSENVASPTIAGSERGGYSVDVPRASMAVSNGSPSPTASQFEDARGSMYSTTMSPAGPVPPARMDPQMLMQQQEAQRAAFMAALDTEPLPPPRRPRGFGSGSGDDSRQRLSAYSAAPAASQDLLGSPTTAPNRHSYAAPTPPSGSAQRSSYVPGSGPKRPPFNPSPFNPSSGNGDGY